MIDAVKEKLLSKGMQLMQSPMVAKLMESEKVGVLLEKAMTLPIKLSDGMRSHREKLTSVLDLATQQDLDDLKRAVSRMEDLLRDVKRESADLLRQSEKETGAKKPVAE
jgi:hypothetical protein